MTTTLTLLLVVIFGGVAAAQSAMIDLSAPMSGPSIYAADADGKPVERGIPLRSETDRGPRTEGLGGGGLAPLCGGSHSGAISCATGRPRTVSVDSYIRKDGTAVRAYHRSTPRRGGSGMRR